MDSSHPQAECLHVFSLPVCPGPAVAQQGLDLGSWPKRGLQLGAIPSEGSIYCPSPPEKALPWQRAKNQHFTAKWRHTWHPDLSSLQPQGELAFPFYLDGRTQLFTSFFIEEEEEMPLWGVRGCPGALGCSPAF